MDPLSQECSDDGKERSERVPGGKHAAIVPDRRPLQPTGLQYFYRRVRCTGEVLIKQYRHCRKLLGNNVKDAHKHWREMVACDNIDPLIKACTLSFSVISTPKTTAYLKQHWDDLWQQMEEDRMVNTPDYQMARFMVQYALAWAMWTQNLGMLCKALKKVNACYNDMKKRNLANFILAPYYTVTIGRWIYEAHSKANSLSYEVITEVVKYANETLQLIETLEDDWARIDAFGAKISALHLLLLAADYLSLPPTDAFWHRRIEQLYRDIRQELHDNRSRIVLYDQAWFHSVSGTYHWLASNIATTEEDKACSCSLAERCAAKSADLYYANGRYWRAHEEAKRTGDPHIIQKYSKLLQDAPGV